MLDSLRAELEKLKAKFKEFGEKDLNIEENLVNGFII